MNPSTFSPTAEALVLINGYGRTTNFKPRFLENLRLALAVYPDAKVDVEEGRGLTLHPSRPPVLKTLPPRRVLLNPTPDE